MFQRHQEIASLTNFPPEALRTERLWRHGLGHCFVRTLDRVNVLGDDESNYGHASCVNALSWARDGSVLLSGGDDRTVRIWRQDANDTDQPYPFVCTSVIRTGHKANIFNAQMLPYSSRIASVAGDRQVRVFDAEVALSVTTDDGREKQHRVSDTCIRQLRCHHGRVKRVVTEESPDIFLTVGEDGTVRQHDLRTTHTCGQGNCPTPIIKCDHELSTLALSPLTPYQFVVAGDSAYGYLFDRRKAGRRLQEEWGALPSPGTTEMATCVRRFGRGAKAPGESRRGSHITGARMSAFNGHEVLLSFSSDAVYLYSTKDDPGPLTDGPSALLPPNALPPPVPKPVASISISAEDPGPSHVPLLSEDGSNNSRESTPDSSDLYAGDFSDDEEMVFDCADEDRPDWRPNVPIVLPRRRFAGACNVETVKDVNFLGPEDEYIASGSDDGNFFIWDKGTGSLHGLYEGDSSVVNVIEGHPTLPLIAVSGIDSTVKLFAPSNGESAFSKMHNAQDIMDVNTRNSNLPRVNFGRLISGRLATMLAAAEGGERLGPECTFQ